MRRRFLLRPPVSDPPWWHTIELPSGHVTPGGWDLRPTAANMPWPDRLDGLRCLDIGTMDGFWAFEMERRGAAEVVATDLYDPPRDTFSLAAEQLGSKVTYRTVAIHDLRADDIGTFDLVVVGDVLQMVADPIGALEAVRRVCSGSVIVLETVSLPLSLLHTPLARLDARRDGREWFVFNKPGLIKAIRLSGFEVEAVTPVLRDRPGPGVNLPGLGWRVRAMHAFGARGRSVAVRGRAPGWAS